MSVLMATWGLAKALEAEGFPVPEECFEARVVMGVDSVICIQFDCHLTAERLAQLGRALSRLAEEQQ